MHQPLNWRRPLPTLISSKTSKFVWKRIREQMLFSKLFSVRSGDTTSSSSIKRRIILKAKEARALTTLKNNLNNMSLPWPEKTSQSLWSSRWGQLTSKVDRKKAGFTDSLESFKFSSVQYSILRIWNLHSRQWTIKTVVKRLISFIKPFTCFRTITYTFFSEILPPFDTFLNSL